MSGETQGDEPAVDARYAVNPAGVALACAGALTMAVATFLPLDEPGGNFAKVESNTLIQHGGWTFLVLGAAIAVKAYRQYSKGQRKWTVVVLGVLALGVAILIGTDDGSRTIYPLDSSGQADPLQPGTVVPLGIAVYAAAVGACLAIFGGRVMRESPKATVKQCPDCAETIQAAAKVCKHCGRRLDEATPVSDSDTTPPAHDHAKFW